MPVVRTYGCNTCGHFLDVRYESFEEAQAAEALLAPECPHCINSMQREYKPVAIGGSTVGKAVALAETIASEDYHVADINHDTRRGGTPKVRYRDQSPASFTPSTWGTSGNMMDTAIAIGRQTRMENGGQSGLDVLQQALKTGAQPDLIEASKRRAMKVW
jgi:hypothetical protein